MTAPAPETLEREQDKLLLTDVEVVRKLGVPERVGRAALDMLDADPRSKFPPKLELWGGRRWWPDVMKWFTENSRKMPNGAARVAPEDRDIRARLLRRFPTDRLTEGKNDPTNTAENS